MEEDRELTVAELLVSAIAQSAALADTLSRADMNERYQHDALAISRACLTELSNELEKRSETEPQS